MTEQPEFEEKVALTSTEVARREFNDWYYARIGEPDMSNINSSLASCLVSKSTQDLNMDLSMDTFRENMSMGTTSMTSSAPILARSNQASDRPESEGHGIAHAANKRD